MAVINLERRAVERLARELVPRFADTRDLKAKVSEIDNVERWRKAARRAGHRLGYPVRTMLSSDGSTVYAFLERPVRPGEQAEAANLVATMIFGPMPPVRL